MGPFAKYLRFCAAIITGTRTKGGRNPGAFRMPGDRPWGAVCQVPARKSSTPKGDTRERVGHASFLVSTATRESVGLDL